MMRSPAHIAVIYALVSGATAIVNLMAQAVSMRLYAGLHAIELSVLVGTAVGLPLKYVLEKAYVFRFKADGLRHDSFLFVFYAFMGVFTTAIFWGIEFAFHFLFAQESMRYLGGAIGLGLGSWIKYKLDKRFVFRRGVA